MTLSFDLAAAYAQIGFADLPPDAIRAASISLADALAVMLAATELEPTARTIAAYALGFGGHDEASLIGQSRRAPAPLAALANGALAHAIDFEDTFDATGMHPNAAVIPAVLALAERDGSDGETIIRALALGCDFICRLSLALAADPAQRGWYHPPMLGALGAALASTLVLELEPDRIVDALGLVAIQFSLTNELTRSPHSHLRAIRDGLAARAGVEAALMAEAGVKGVAQPLEGKSGLFAMLTGAGPNKEVLFDDLGTRFCGTEVTIKRWPSCRGTHAAIAAGLDLRARGIAPERIGDIAFAVSPPDDMLLRPEAQKQKPATPIDAKFSIPFTIATALVTGEVTLASFDTRRLGDESVLALASRARLDRVVEPGRERISFLLDGIAHQEALVRPDGARAATVAEADLMPKLESCLAAAGQAGKADALVSACLDLPENGLAPLISVVSDGVG